MTKQRALMLEIFRSGECCGKHRTAEELVALAKAKMPNISRATVYNNLRSMESEGLIRRITAESGADYYDASSVLHGHLICKRCGGIIDVQTPYLLDELEQLVGKELDSYELKMRYICPTCAKS